MKPSYDTIHCWLPRDYIKTTEHEIAILSKLTNARKVDDENWGLSYTGKLNNLIVRFTERRITIIGSIPKYYYGDNLHPLSLADTKLAIDKLSNQLSLPLHEAQVTRLDIACNLIMEQPIALYLHYLGHINHFIRLKQPNSLYYNKGKKDVPDKQLVFYDKVKEMKKNKEKLSPALKALNILRYEMRYRSGINQQLKATVTVGMLLKHEFYQNLVKRWHDGYLKITKERRLRQGVTDLNLIDDFTLLGELALLKLFGGQMKIIEALNEEKKLKPYTPARKASASRISKKIKRLASHPEFTFQSPLVDELDHKIAETVRLSFL